MYKYIYICMYEVGTVHYEILQASYVSLQSLALFYIVTVHTSKNVNVYI